MKKLFYVIFIVVALLISNSYADQVTFEWDYPPEEMTKITGFKLFQREANAVYNYASPVWTGSNTLTATLNELMGVEGQETTYNFVVRAYLNDGSKVIESGDSNEVSYTVDRIKPEPVTITAVNYENGNVILSWNDNNDRSKIQFWEIKFSTSPTGEFNVFTTVNNTGQTELTSSVPLTVNNDKITYYFTVVAYKTPTLYSIASNVASVNIDTRFINNPINIRISVKKH